MVERDFEHLRETRDIHQGELWWTTGALRSLDHGAEPVETQPRLVVILSPDDVTTDPETYDVRVAPLSDQVAHASELDLKLDLGTDMRFDHPEEDLDVLPRNQMLELWNSQSMLKVHLDCKIGSCTPETTERIKQIMDWKYGFESPPVEVPAWVGPPIERQDDPRLRFQEQEEAAVRAFREPVDQLYRLWADEEESEEIEEEFVLDDGEVQEYIEAFEALEAETSAEDEEQDERLSRFLRESVSPAAFAAFKGPCPDTPTFVDYQEGRLPSEQMAQVKRHVVFCRACLEDLAMLARADEVDYNPDRDYAADAELPAALRHVLFEHLSDSNIAALIAGQLPAETRETYLEHLKFCRRCLDAVTSPLQAAMALATTARLVRIAVGLLLRARHIQRARVQGRRLAAAEGQEVAGVVLEPDGTERPVQLPVEKPPQIDQQGVFTLTLGGPEDEDFEDDTVQVWAWGELLATGTFVTFLECQLQQRLPDEIVHLAQTHLEADDFPLVLPLEDLQCRIQRQQGP